MPYRYLWTDRGIEFECFGEVSAEEIIESNQRFIEDPKSDESSYQLVAMLHVERWLVSEKHTTQMAAVDFGASKSLGKMRIALVIERR